MKILFGMGFGILNYLFLKQLPRPKNWIKFGIHDHYPIMKEITHTEKGWREIDRDRTKRNIFTLKKL